MTRGHFGAKSPIHINEDGLLKDIKWHNSKSDSCRKRITPFLYNISSMHPEKRMVSTMWPVVVTGNIWCFQSFFKIHIHFTYSLFRNLDILNISLTNPGQCWWLVIFDAPNLTFPKLSKSPQNIWAFCGSFILAPDKSGLCIHKIFNAKSLKKTCDYWKIFLYAL